MLEERSQLFALSFLEEGLLIGSQGLFGDRLPAFGLLSNHLGTSFTSKLLCRLVGGHAKLLTGSTIDLEDREASPSMSIGLLLSAILVEDVHRAVRVFHDSYPNWIQVLQVDGHIGELGDVDCGMSRRHMMT